MEDYKKIQKSVAGLFNRVNYTDKDITVQLVGTLSARDLTQDQIDYIKGFYNKPSARIEIVNEEPYKNELLKLILDWKYIKLN